MIATSLNTPTVVLIYERTHCPLARSAAAREIRRRGKVAYDLMGLRLDTLRRMAVAAVA